MNDEVVTEPPRAVSVIGPVTAPVGTLTVTAVFEFANAGSVKSANLFKPNFTEVIPVNSVPLMVNNAPIFAALVDIDETVGLS